MSIDDSSCRQLGRAQAVSIAGFSYSSFDLFCSFRERERECVCVCCVCVLCVCVLCVCVWVLCVCVCASLCLCMRVHVLLILLGLSYECIHWRHLRAAEMKALLFPTCFACGHAAPPLAATGWPHVT